MFDGLKILGLMFLILIIGISAFFIAWIITIIIIPAAIGIICLTVAWLIAKEYITGEI